MKMKEIDLIVRYKTALDEVNQYDTPNGVTFAKHGSHWYSYDDSNTTLSTLELAKRCANEEIANNENERDWGYGDE